jgi:pyruvate/2-oxoglutarate dehydrogenase complex dihydrolipoamide dehydrogenase (E3) component
VVIGAGPIGLELAQAFRRLGSEVIVVEAASPLAKDDPECATIVLDMLAREGVEIRAGTKVLQVEAGSDIKLALESPAGSDTIEGSHLLVAAGRRANIEGLDRQAAGIRHNARGISVGKGLKTTNRRVYAIGDVIGGLQFTHVSNYHAGLVIRNALFRLPVRARNDAVPWVTYTDPELAHVGLTEVDARKRGAIRVLRWPYHENDRAQAERETRGHIKVVTSRRGRVLGATIVGAQAGELIAPWSLAVHQGLNVRAFAEAVLPYPTLAEIGKRAAMTYFTSSLTSPWVRRIIALLRGFG